MQLLIETGDCQSHRLFPNPNLPVDLIAEDRTYTLRLVGPADRDLLAGCQLILGDVAQGAGRLEKADELSWTWTAAEYAGELTVGLQRADGHLVWPVCELVIDPNRSKLTRTQFLTMIDDINAEAAIAYSLSPATQRVELGQYRQSLGLAHLEYTRQQIRPLQRAIEAIARRPRKVLVHEEECADLPLVQTADDRSLAWLLTRPGELAEVQQSRTPTGVRSFHQQMKGHLPRRLQVRRRVVSYDIYENQLIKHFLQRLTTVLRHTMLRLMDTAEDLALDEPIRSLARRRLGELSQYRHILYNLSDLDFLQEVGPLRYHKQVTQTFRKDPLYARFYNLYRQFDRAITPFDGAPFRLSLEKTWQLYEYWCFFQVIAALRQLVGDEIEFDARPLLAEHPDRISLALPQAEVQVSQRLRVYFQKTYGYYGWPSGLDQPRSGTYSHAMRPDISIESHDEHGRVQWIVLLDPKYRAHERSINDALNDMHRYKDAIVDQDRRRPVLAALALCPTAEHAKPLYFREDYIQTHGLGALVLRPGDADAAELLASQLEPILATGGTEWQTTD